MLIEENKILKLTCLDDHCGTYLTMDDIKQVLSLDHPEVISKYIMFKEKKLLESDPLVRWCPNRSCGKSMKAKSFDQRKMTCESCQTSVCFRCKEEWHGYFTSCEQAMEANFQGWAGDRYNISFCPMCRTKIEKNEGCNHMTCAFCQYEFCWLCGGDASSESNHWAPGHGCGADMMEEYTKKV